MYNIRLRKSKMRAALFMVAKPGKGNAHLIFPSLDSVSSFLFFNDNFSELVFSVNAFREVR